MTDPLYNPQKNAAAGNKHFAITGLSTIIAAGLSWLVAHYALTLSPETQAEVVAASTTLAGTGISYLLGRLRNWQKHA